MDISGGWDGFGGRSKSYILVKCHFSLGCYKNQLVCYIGFFFKSWLKKGRFSECC